MPEPAFDLRRVSCLYGEQAAVKDVTMVIPGEGVTAFIGPSGCGKSTLLRCFNRMNDVLPHFQLRGQIFFGHEPLYSPERDPVEIRRRVGMVFQRSNPFPTSIFNNVAFGLKLHFKLSRADLELAVEKALRAAALWEEVKDRLHTSALRLSGGQQQRLCIARALAVEPEVMLFDEPASALDPLATAKVEELVLELGKRMPVVIVTHNLAQAARVAHRTAFFLGGRLVEYAPTVELFSNPQQPETELYLRGSGR